MFKELLTMFKELLIKFVKMKTTRVLIQLADSYGTATKIETGFI